MGEPLLGEVYRDILAESGVNFLDGTYAHVADLAQAARDTGVQYRPSRDVRAALWAVGVDGVVSEMVEIPCKKNPETPLSRHVVTTCSLSSKIPIYGFDVAGSPREQLEGFQKAAELFLSLPREVRMYLIETPEYDEGSFSWNKGHVLEAFGTGYRMREEPTATATEMIQTLRVFFPDTKQGNAEALAVMGLLDGGEPLEQMELYDVITQIPPEVVPEEWTRVTVDPLAIKGNLEGLASRMPLKMETVDEFARRHA